jgi:hypothetical protein
MKIFIKTEASNIQITESLSVNTCLFCTNGVTQICYWIGFETQPTLRQKSTQNYATFFGPALYSLKSFLLPLLLASGNAYPTDMESSRLLTPKLFNGRALVILKSGEDQGTINLKGSSLSLQSLSIIVHTY